MLNAAPYRAALWIPRAVGSSVRLTSSDEAHLTDADLTARGEDRVASHVGFMLEWSAYGAIIVVADWKD